MTGLAGAPSGDGALGRLTQAEGALIAALDAGEVVGIEQAVRTFSDALTEVRAIGRWSASPETARAVRFALQLIDAAAARTNFLADQGQRRLDAVLRARGDAPRIGYGRTAQGYA